MDYHSVLPARRNPKLADHGGDDPIRRAQEEFNATYCSMLGRLEQAFNGRPAQLGDAIGLMYALKAGAQSLMQMPDGGGQVAGPTFDYVPRVRRYGY